MLDQSVPIGAKLDKPGLIKAKHGQSVPIYINCSRLSKSGPIRANRGKFRQSKTSKGNPFIPYHLIQVYNFVH